MATRRDLTKKYAREYQRAGKKEKGQMLGELCAATGWSRANARRAISKASARTGPASAARRKPRERKYSYDALQVLKEVWKLSGEPCGKYLAAAMEDLLARLIRFRELGKVGTRLTPEVLLEVRSMSGSTIDRYLKPVKAARYPAAKSATSPARILRASIPLRTAMDGFPAEP
ncbi:MAG: integrase, partial [Propionibacteriaceae bacterium]|nr:integrase [Propionibacteriaceae bacterium]